MECYGLDEGSFQLHEKLERQYANRKVPWISLKLADRRFVLRAQEPWEM